MKNWYIPIVLTLGLLVSSCIGANNYAPIEEAIESIEVKDYERFNAIIITDVTAARDLAVADSDEIAVVCWDGVLEFLDRVDPSVFVGESQGVAHSYQKARVVRRFLEGDMPVDLKLACSAMVGESKNVFKKLLRIMSPV